MSAHLTTRPWQHAHISPIPQNAPQSTLQDQIGKCVDGFQVHNLLPTTDDAMISLDFRSHTHPGHLSHAMLSAVLMTSASHLSLEEETINSTTNATSRNMID